MSIQPIVLNDVHSRLNATRVERVIRPSAVEHVVRAVREARAAGVPLSVAGCRHSMGGQQFATGAWHLDMRSMNRFLGLDAARRVVRVEAGMTWPELLKSLEAAQSGEAPILTFRQKQTGADDLTLGGAVSSNIHGRGLRWAPLVADVESVTVVRADGEVVRASREVEGELFRLVVGGYGLFGIVVEVKLRLVPRMRVERVVEVTGIDGVIGRFDARAAEGCVLGDFQFCPDESSEGFLREGVFACYRPATIAGSPPDAGLELDGDDWKRLVVDAHHRKAEAWRSYTGHYLKTNGQHYSHDRAQLGHYDSDYARWVHEACPQLGPGSLMITELYVPHDHLEGFMAASAAEIRMHKASLVYGTIRLIEPDRESFLPWARERFACVVMNLRVAHSEDGLARAGAVFRGLIDRALERNGSFFLTYHRWATGDQMRRAHPRIGEFFRLKRAHDPDEVFQSDWYRHWRSEF